MIRCITLSLALLASVACAEDSAVGAFQTLARELPKESTFASSDKPYTITPGTVDVKRTTSLVHPILGQLDYSITTESPGSGIAKLDLRLEFAWKDGKWKFQRLLNRKSRKDITSLPLGKDMIESGALHEFLVRYGL